MTKLLSAGAALLLSTGIANAGGLDRSGQGIGAIFESGKYVELSYGVVTPSVSGTFMGTPSGNIAPAYTSLGFAVKTDVNDKISLALIMDQPFGANVSYPVNGYPLQTTMAEVKTTGITLLGRYKINNSFSAHAGVRSITSSGFYDPAGPYASTYSKDSDTAYVVGAAFEKPEIALRVALTYSSATSFAMDGTVGDATAEMPQSVNLDFQSGIAANTLLFGSIRWADWTEATVDDTIAMNLVDYTDDVYSYTLGVGRKFSEAFSGSIALGYEAAQGGLASNLSPTDGYKSIQVGGAYTLDSGVKISGGIRYVMVGDAVTEPAGPFPGGADFADNSAIGVGIKVGYTF